MEIRELTSITGTLTFTFDTQDQYTEALANIQADAATYSNTTSDPSSLSITTTLNSSS